MQIHSLSTFQTVSPAVNVMHRRYTHHSPNFPLLLRLYTRSSLSPCSVWFYFPQPASGRDFFFKSCVWEIPQ